MGGGVALGVAGVVATWKASNWLKAMREKGIEKDMQDGLNMYEVTGDTNEKIPSTHVLGTLTKIADDKYKFFKGSKGVLFSWVEFKEYIVNKTFQHEFFRIGYKNITIQGVTGNIKGTTWKWNQKNGWTDPPEENPGD
jgi:hypothetical protein